MRLDHQEEVDAEAAPLDLADARDEQLDLDALDIERQRRADADAEVFGEVFFEADLVAFGID